MTVVGVGVDVVSPSRAQRLLTRFDDPVLGTVLTPTELNQVHRSPWPAWRLALCLGVKEACGKALGTGLVGLAWTDLEALAVVGHDLRPRLSGAAGSRARERGVCSWTARWGWVPGYPGRSLTVTAIAWGVEPVAGPGTG